MSRTQYKDTDYEYEILENGYDIYFKGGKIIEQHDPYGKVFKADGTYEENAIIQLDDLSTPVSPTPSQEEINRADIDYIALMEDLDLPSYNTDEEVAE